MNGESCLTETDNVVGLIVKSWIPVERSEFREVINSPEVSNYVHTVHCHYVTVKNQGLASESTGLPREIAGPG